MFNYAIIILCYNLCLVFKNGPVFFKFGTLSILIGAHEFGSKINIFGANCALELVQNNFNWCKYDLIWC